MSAIVLSDLHLESIHSHSHLIDRFLESLPEGYQLVLNGDIIDSSYPNLPLHNLRILEFIRRQSYCRKVVWIRGNHDNCSAIRGRGQIVFARSYTISDRLIITHGNELDKAKPLIHLLIRPFKTIQFMRIRAGLKPVNVVRLAKRVEPFYRLYRWKLMRDAVRFAKKNGFEAITCGHAHHPEDRVFRGVRYINTGAWTEYPPYYLMVNEREMRLQRYAKKE